MVFRKQVDFEFKELAKGINFFVRFSSTITYSQLAKNIGLLLSSNLFFTSDANSAGEPVLVELEIDLDHNLCFNPVHLKLLKNRLTCHKSKANPTDVQEWTLGPDSQFEAIYQHGLGTLKITLASGAELRWNFTTQKKPQVYQFIQDCKKALGVVLETITTICPGCGGILKTDELCLTCNPLPAQKGTSLKMLLRLFEFSKPQMPLIVLGFFLTLFSTLVGLIPPYLVMPLTDDVLIPISSASVAAILLYNCLPMRYSKLNGIIMIVAFASAVLTVSALAAPLVRNEVMKYFRKLKRRKNILT